MALTSPARTTFGEYAGLAKHLALSALVFAILLLPVVGLEMIATFLLQRGLVSRVVVYALTMVEYMLLAIDALLFVASVLVQTVRTLRRMHKDAA